MKYIFLVAGKGSRLQPLTLNHPKSQIASANWTPAR